MKYSYYPGCSLCSTASEYNLSSEAICAKLGIALEEINDWNCCGATVAHATSAHLSVALPLRNLVLAEPQGLDVVVPCAACYHWLRVAHHQVVENTPAGRRANQEMAAVMGQKYRGSLQVKHLLEVLMEPQVLAMIKRQLEKPLTGLKLAAYYGCLMLRPGHVVAFDDPEQPRQLDNITTALGAEAVRWSDKVECCGGSFTLAESGVVSKLSADIISAARRGGAEAIVTACPLCQANLDTRQQEGTPKMPVFYITELMGVALGMPQYKKWFKKHLVDPMPLLKEKGLV
ncbi:CoB--CoM heterodisulfide reductase iron-sulfur subunit B family protein [Desulfofalx alkaliphila]|uniref:CoB--CoM heterodisulfide reductase iron-sulfur subunit B family protein n=1 Tax=Desulfofalx alkaliphila TaxID=105483 RepID=UPI0004E1A47D|nr:CoB--CoM heterodisulfide reductase iron-sulfur subunit B family protein [Desulfofalx alkaliphila]